MGKTIKIIYGSSTGNTRRAAEAIAAKLGGEVINVADAGPDDFKADLLILGTSTWGCGELQDDWQNALPILESADLSGVRVAFFGLGDSTGFSDTFVNGMAELAEKAVAAGGEPVGKWSSDSYSHTGSTAEENGFFVGLALDDDNEPGETAGRIDQWCTRLAGEL